MLDHPPQRTASPLNREPGSPECIASLVAAVGLTSRGLVAVNNKNKNKRGNLKDNFVSSYFIRVPAFSSDAFGKVDKSRLNKFSLKFIARSRPNSTSKPTNLQNLQRGRREGRELSENIQKGPKAKPIKDGSQFINLPL